MTGERRLQRHVGKIARWIGGSEHMVAFTGAGALKGWIKHPHKAKPGYTPLEVYEK